MSSLTDPAVQRPRLAAVVGWPIAHSLSPLIHATWLEQNNLKGWYIPVAVEPTKAAFQDAADHLRGLGFQGFNVTLPHKEHALEYCAAASERARQAGAANMVTFTAEGAVADNSDVTGFAAAVGNCIGEGHKFREAFVIGAGGAARGVVIALQEMGVGSITIANRTQAKAETLARAFGLKTHAWSAVLTPLAETDLVINTIALGTPDEARLAIDFDPMAAGALIADINYIPLESALLKGARARGFQTLNGLSMLIHQAAPGFEQWFAGAARVDQDLRRLLEAALTERISP